MDVNLFANSAWRRVLPVKVNRHEPHFIFSSYVSVFKRIFLSFCVLLFAFCCPAAKFDSFDITFSFPKAFADDLSYSYDSLNRVIQVSNSASNTAIIYQYDAAGNITAQTTVATDALRITGFSPIQGFAGDKVKLIGTGFSTTPSANVVTFNGVTATVLSATLTELTVEVPLSATTGPIKVVTSGVTATSARVFTIGSGPRIVSFSPLIAAGGTLVNITGTNFEPTALGNKVRFNISTAVVSSASTNAISTNVPSNATSGRIYVTTAKGAAVSAADFIVPPNGYIASNISFGGRIVTDGSSLPVSPSAGKAQVVLFDGSAGDFLALGVSGSSIPTTSIKIFKPDGTSLISKTITANGQGVQLPQLPVTGVYVVVVDSGSSSGSFNLAIFKPIKATLKINDPAMTVSFTPPGRRALLSFSGTQNGFINIGLSDISLSSGTLSVLNPDGTTLLTKNISPGAVEVRPQLPQSGVYTVVIVPTGDIGGSLNISVGSLVTNLVADSSAYGLAVVGQNISALNFSGIKGQYLTLNINENYDPLTQISCPAGNQSNSLRYFSVSVLSPDGSVLTTSASTANELVDCRDQFGSSTGGWKISKMLNLGPLPLSGGYKILVQQTPSTATASGTLNFSLFTPIAGVATVNGGTYATTTTKPGQAIIEKFSATSGQYLALNINQNSDPVTGVSCPAGNEANKIYRPLITVFKPDGTILTSSSVTESETSSCTYVSGNITTTAPSRIQKLMNLGPMPVSGTYTVLVQMDPAYGSSAQVSGTLNFSLFTPVAGVATVNGGTYSTTTTKPGQAIIEKFSATSGQYLALNINQNSDPVSGVSCPAGNEANKIYRPLITVFKPDGTILSSSSVTAAETSSCTYVSGNITTTAYSRIQKLMNLGPMPVSGTYTVLVQMDPAYGSSAQVSGTLNFSLFTPVTGVATVNGGTYYTTTTKPGQAIIEKFNATSGQYLALNINQNYDPVTGVSCPAGNEANKIYRPQITIFKPDGAILTSSSVTDSETFSCTYISGNITTTAYSRIQKLMNLGPMPVSGTYTILVQMDPVWSSSSQVSGTLGFYIKNL